MRIAAHESHSRRHFRMRKLLGRPFEADYGCICRGYRDVRGEDSQSAADFQDEARGLRVEESYKLFIGEMIECGKANLLARAGAMNVPRARLSAFWRRHF